MKKQPCTRLFIGFVITSLFSVPLLALQMKGTAKSLDGKAVIYLENHKIELGENGLNKKIETSYSTPDGKVFATMISDFSKSSLIPEVLFKDDRFGKTETVSFTEGNRIVFKTDFSDAKSKDKSSEKSYTLTKDMVAGQGFDNFVKINFEQLQKNKVPLNFGVLSEMAFFSFKGYQKPSNSEQEKNDIVKFGINLTNPLYRLFSGELVLEYDRKTKIIKSYRGLSNLQSDNGKSQNVLINYEIINP